LYHGFVQSLAQRVLSHVRRHELLKAGDRVGVAVSGGIDSAALLRLLLELRSELGIVLSVVHFNHKLRGAESDADEQFVEALARDHGLEFYADSDDVARAAAEERVSVEAAAREVRYGFFRYLLGEDGDSESVEVNVEIPTSGKTGQKWGTHTGSHSKPVLTRLTKIVTGHTLDDQAETVLMRMIRGAGTRGLGGIYPRIAVEDDAGKLRGEIVRPLLEFRRRELRQYLFDIRQEWREDSTNSDEALTRNRVRKQVIPLLEREFNPSVAENLAELAEIARGEEDYWENEAAGWTGTVVHWSEPEWVKKALSAADLVQIQASDSGGEPIVPEMRSQKTRMLGTARPDPSLSKKRFAQDDNALLRERIENAPWLVMNASVSRIWFLAEPVAVQRRLVKAIGDEAGISLEFKHVEEILHFAEEDSGSGKELSLPQGWKLRRDAEELVFLTPNLLTPDLCAPGAASDYEYPLAVPGETIIHEVGVVVEVRRVPAELLAEYNAGHLLDAESLPGPLRVRNWRPGDRFWPTHTKSPKKIKELLQELHLAQAERRLWPVIVSGDGASGDEIVWVRGFPRARNFAAQPGREAILIMEKPLEEEQS
jgi:tRNA(Ile)-lysidine synthetase-like protein